MQNNNPLSINKWLLPFSWLYGIVVFFRNKFFEWGIFKQKKYDIPVICVGNITVGGTGKTPHIEYLVKLLKNRYKVAVLSRGYMRSTSGFVLATDKSTSSQIGDEPYQIKFKYPEIIIAVDSNRRRGIEKLLNLPAENKPDVILLDDAFQHRYVKPSYTILLTDYNRLMTQDKLLPAGKLREPVYYAEYANMILITKSPPDLNPLEQRLLIKEVNPYPYQDLLFTRFRYGNITPLFFPQKLSFELHKLKEKSVLVVTGIANPAPLHEMIRKYTRKMGTLVYPDHHKFTQKDILKIKSSFDSMEAENKIILVTEKDAARLRSMNKIEEDLKNFIYYLPIQVTFASKEEQELFNTKILEHVRENT